jgi:hypothetical protein
MKSSKIAFLDTLSLHSAVGGLSSQQRSKWMQYQADKKKQGINPLTFSNSLMAIPLPL